MGYGDTLNIVVPKRKTQKEVETDQKEKDLKRRKNAFRELCKSKYEDRRLFIEGIALGTYQTSADEESEVEKK